MFLKNYFLLFILFIISLVLSFIILELFALFFKLIVHLSSLMVPNPGAGSSSSENGNNKPNKDWSWTNVFESAAGGALASIGVKGAQALFSEPETSKHVVNNISHNSYKFVPKLPFSSACVLGLSFPLGCYILTMNREKPQVPKPDFIPSAAEASCFENCIYLIKHPWILVLTGLETISFIIFFGLIAKAILKIFTINNTKIKTFTYIFLFMVLSVLIGPYKPLTWLATAYDTDLYQNFLYVVITDSPLIWKNITWFWYTAVTIGYSSWIYIVLRFYRNNL